MTHGREETRCRRRPSAEEPQEVFALQAADDGRLKSDRIRRPRLAVEKGELTACAAICPTGATQFGDRDALLAEAKKRIAENPAYVKKVYGSEEVGGTSILFLSDVPFEKLGFVAAPQTQPLPVLSATALGEMPTVVLVGGSPFMNSQRTSMALKYSSRLVT